MKSTFTPTPLWLALIGALCTLPTLAGAQSAAQPSAGTLLQQVPAAPALAPAANRTGLTLPAPAHSDLPTSAPILVKAIRLTGHSAFPTATLDALVADSLGQTLTLTQLGELAKRIGAYYQANGYPLARAIVPAQKLETTTSTDPAATAGNTVVIQVVEAQFGKTGIDNQSPVRTELLQATLDSLTPGSAVMQAPLDRALLLLSDIPNVAVQTVLRPGEAVGSSDLRVSVTPAGKAVAGNLLVDSYGNKYTGRNRLSGNVNWYNPLNHGDVASVNVLTSGQNMAYGRVAYDTLLNGQGTRLGASLAAMQYTLGDSLAALDAHGTARVASLWVRQPLLRSLDSNAYAQLQLDRSALRDLLDTAQVRNVRQLNTATLSLNGNAGTAGAADRTHVWGLGVTAGRLAFDDAPAQRADAGSAQTQGQFSKLNASLTSTQVLAQNTSLNLALAAQYASKNLDASQKMIAGGPSTVRAYDVGSLSGDQGWRATLELRRTLASNDTGQWTTQLFYDTASLSSNAKPWAATTGSNTNRLSGLGVGLSWFSPQGVNLKLSVAKPVGNKPAALGTVSASRAWLEMSWGF